MAHAPGHFMFKFKGKKNHEKTKVRNRCVVGPDTLSLCLFRLFVLSSFRDSSFFKLPLHASAAAAGDGFDFGELGHRDVAGEGGQQCAVCPNRVSMLPPTVGPRLGRRSGPQQSRRRPPMRSITSSCFVGATCDSPSSQTTADQS